MYAWSSRLTIVDNFSYNKLEESDLCVTIKDCKSSFSYYFKKFDAGFIRRQTIKVAYNLAMSDSIVN
jgi:hypothetical protein